MHNEECIKTPCLLYTKIKHLWWIKLKWQSYKHLLYIIIIRGIYRDDLRERRNVEKVMQIESYLYIGLFGLISFDQKINELTKLNSVWFWSQPNYNWIKVAPNWTSKMGLCSTPCMKPFVCDVINVWECDLMICVHIRSFHRVFHVSHVMYLFMDRMSSVFYARACKVEIGRGVLLTRSIRTPTWIHHYFCFKNEGGISGVFLDPINFGPSSQFFFVITKF